MLGVIEDCVMIMELKHKEEESGSMVKEMNGFLDQTIK